MNGLLVVDKPSGWTSFDVVAKIRRLTGVRRVGHAGTLDPLATGVLVVCIGQATRLLEYLTGADKVYRSSFCLGVATSTDDADGEVIARTETSHLTCAGVAIALRHFVGDIEQIPPRVSAVKVGGVRAYQLARGGRDVDLRARRVHVARADLRSCDLPAISVEVACGSGTYIRSLARDLGAMLGVGGHVTALRRTRVGAFDEGQAHTIDELVAMAERGAFAELMLPGTDALRGWPVVALDPARETKIRQGQSIAAEADQPPPKAVGLDTSGRIVAILEQRAGLWKPAKVLAQDES